jgi:PAS domain S-box-containing protein
MKPWTVESLSLAGAGVVLALAAAAAIAVASRLQHLPVDVLALLALSAGMAAISVAVLLRIRRLTLSRNRAHARLLESEGVVRHLVETAHEGIWQLGLDGKARFANQRLSQMFGCSRQALHERPMCEFLGENPPALLATLSDGSTPAGSTHDLCYRRGDGSRGWAIASSRLLFDGDGARSGTLLMLTDITERKAAETQLAEVQRGLEARIKLRTAELIRSNEQLRAEVGSRQAAQRALALSEQRLQEIIATMPVALFLKDAASRIILMNKASEEQWGMCFAEVAGTRASASFPPEQMAKFLADDQAVFAGRKLQVIEEEVWNAVRNTNRQVQTFKKPIFGADGEPHFLICMSIDITERKLAEEQLQSSYRQLRQLTEHLETIKEEERRRIALDIHDDLGQNLMALKIDIEMLHARVGERHPQLRKRVRTVLDTIDATIRAVREIINDLHPSTLDLGLPAALEWMLEQFEQRSGIACSLAVSGDPSLRLEIRRTTAIFRIVQETLVNILRHAEASQVEVSLHLQAEQLAILIADDGIGMQPGDAGKAAAFGLRGIKERVDAFGGELLIDSRRGNGTTLSIVMPAGASTSAMAPG